MVNIKIKAFKEAVYDRTQRERSAWMRGVAKYALDILENLEERGINEINPFLALFRKQCLNGAESWKQYSEGGNALVYDFEIAERLFTPKESRLLLRKLQRGGRVNQHEEILIETQTRALNQAFMLIQRISATHAHKYDATKN